MPIDLEAIEARGDRMNWMKGTDIVTMLRDDYAVLLSEVRRQHQALRVVSILRRIRQLNRRTGKRADAVGYPAAKPMLHRWNQRWDLSERLLERLLEGEQ